jgi:hypothetical protein
MSEFLLVLKLRRITPMALRSIQQLIHALAITEGAGVTVHRTIGTPRLRHLDPFLLLDHFASNDPDDYIAGFPDHPHLHARWTHGTSGQHGQSR